MHRHRMYARLGLAQHLFHRVLSMARPGFFAVAGWRVGSICWLYRNADIIAQELGGEVGPIRPDKRVKLRMNLELPEYDGIAQRFKDGPAESRRQIDPAARPVAKAQPHDVAGHVARLDNVIVRDPHSSGATRLRGCPCLGGGLAASCSPPL